MADVKNLLELEVLTEETGDRRWTVEISVKLPAQPNSASFALFA